MRPNKGRDMLHWFLQSSNIITFKTVLKICWSISGCCFKTCKNNSPPPGTTAFFLPGYPENIWYINTIYFL